MSSSSFQNEIPKARINIKLDLHTGGAQKKMELPLKLLVMGDYSNGQEQRPLSEREKLNINKNNFNSVLAEFQPSLKLAVPDTLAGDNTDTHYGDSHPFGPYPDRNKIGSPGVRAL